MTLSLLQMQSFNYFAIIYSFNTLTDFVKNLLCIFDWNSFFFFFFLIMTFEGKEPLRSMFSPYFESCIMKMLVQI